VNSGYSRDFLCYPKRQSHMFRNVADPALKTSLLLRDAMCPSRTNGSSIDESVATLVWLVPIEGEGHHGPYLSRIATGKLKGERLYVRLTKRR
jgi:hypothetical protein